MSGGYMNHILHVDLESKEYWVEVINEQFQRKYLGGNGFGAYYLYKDTPKKIDPLSEKNVLVLATGPLTGSGFCSSAMTSICTKSPLTGLFVDSYFGGHFGVELKQAGYDAVVIKGASENPVYLYISNDKIEFKDAGYLWGQKTFKAQELIKKDLGMETQVACIGPAGENLVKYACVISETRAAGRGGVGAVMGSKKLKAIAVFGTKTIRVNNSEELMTYNLSNNEKIKKNPSASINFPLYGSTASLGTYSSMGILGTRNWQTENFPQAEQISGELNKERGLMVRSRACNACIIRSSKIWKAGSGPYFGYVAEGPEYETLFSFGSLCGNDNFDAIVAADRLCDEYGLDTISTGSTIAFAMECFEKNFLTVDDTGGIELRFGNHEGIISLIKKIANRDGFGDFLAEGTKRMSEKLGSETIKFAMHVKGYDFAGHSARVHKGQAVGYATSNRGGSHQDTRVVPERQGMLDRSEIRGKGKFAKESQDATTIGDCLIICRRSTEISYGYFLNEELLELINLATGHNYTIQELTNVAERVYTLEKMFNVREGISRKDDTLPHRLLHEPIPDGPTKGVYASEDDLNKMLDEYYEVRGWDKKTSHPTRKALEKLELTEMIIDLSELQK